MHISVDKSVFFACPAYILSQWCVRCVRFAYNIYNQNKKYKCLFPMSTVMVFFVHIFNKQYPRLKNLTQISDWRLITFSLYLFTFSSYNCDIEENIIFFKIAIKSKIYQCWMSLFSLCSLSICNLLTQYFWLVPLKS